MIKKILTFAGMSLLALMVVACNRIEPIEAPQNQPVPVGLTQTQVKNAIVTAAQQKGWNASEASTGVIAASIDRHGHVAEVRIPYSTKYYAIEYLSSSRLDANGQGQIHRHYNDWVAQLNERIQGQLAMTPINPPVSSHKSTTKAKPATQAKPKSQKTVTTTTTASATAAKATATTAAATTTPAAAVTTTK